MSTIAIVALGLGAACLLGLVVVALRALRESWRNRSLYRYGYGPWDAVNVAQQELQSEKKDKRTEGSGKRTESDDGTR